MTFNDVGDEGAIALATAILESGSKFRPILCWNRIGLAGQSALIQAFEASHGVTFKNLMSVVLNAPFFLPAFLVRANGRGWRRRLEGI